MTPALPPEVDDLQDDQDQQDQDQPRVSGADYLASVNQPKISGADYLKQATQPKPEGHLLRDLWQEGVVNPAKQVAAGYYGASQRGAHLLGNVAEGVGKVTGTHPEKPIRDAENFYGQREQELAGGRSDVASQVYRGLGAAPVDLAKLALASEAAGPVAGMAAVEGLTEADKGPKAATVAAAKGALMGAGMHTMAPASMPVRVAGSATMFGGQAAAEGGSPEDVTVAALTGAGMGIPGGRGSTLRELRRDPRVPLKMTEPELPLSGPDATPRISAQDYLKNVGTEAKPAAAESAKTFEQGLTYAELFDQADKLEARRARTKPEVPETGIPEQVARVADARERLAAKLAEGKSFGELKNSDRIAVDDLITQGYGFAADKPAPEPTAEAPTIPEKPDTIDAQMEQLKGGARSAVMIPLGTKMPSRIPKTLNVIRVPKVGSFVFDSDSITPKEIRVAARENRLTDILGAKEGGMGAPDKSQLQPPVAAVVGKTPEGVTTQGTLADETSLPTAIEQTQKLTPPDGSVQVVPPEQEVAARQQPEISDTLPRSEAGGEQFGAGGEKPPVYGSRPPSGATLPGEPTEVLVPGENTSFKGHYEVRELSDLYPSHNGVTFQPNPEYHYTNDRDYNDPRNRERVVKQAAEFEPRYLVTDNPDATNGPPVIDVDGNTVGGNSRVMTLQRVYGSRPESVQQYRDTLAKRAAGFGIDPNQVAGMKEPVLVRVLDGADTASKAQQAITDLNKSGTASLTSSERALADARRVPPQLLEDIANRISDQGEGGTLAQALAGTGGREVLQNLSDAGLVSQQELPSYLNEKQELTDAAKDRISKLLIGTLFDDPAALDSTAPSVRNKLARVVGQIARTSARPEWDLTPKVKAALDLIREADAHNIHDLDDLARQQGLFGKTGPDPEALTIAKAIRTWGVRDLDRAFKQYAGEEMMSRPGAPATMFEPPSREDSFAENFSKSNGERGAIPADPLGLIPFFKKDVLPVAQKLASGSREAIDGLVHLLAPRKGVAPKTLDEVYRLKGGREAAQFILNRQLETWSAAVNKLPEQGMIEFIDRQKTGKPQLTPELQQLSDFLRKADDSIYSEIQKYNPSLNYLENHFRVLWDKLPNPAQGSLLPNQSSGVRGLFARRPLQGSKGMLKQHTLDTISEGIQRGGVPVTLNPIRMFELSYADSMKYITAQKMWDGFGRMGLREFAASAKDIPDGFVPLDDRIAKVYFKTPEGLTAKAGEWYVEENAGRILNNFLSRDLIRENPVGRAAMAVKNGTTAVELAISPFHAVFEGNEAAGSSIGIGLRRIVNLGFRQHNMNELLKGVGNVLTAPFEALPGLRAKGIGTERLGAHAKELFGNFDEFSKTDSGKQLLKDFPDAEQLVQDYFDGGGKLHMPEDYRLRAYQSFRETAVQSLREGNMPGFALRAIPAANEMIMSPLFEHYIPNLKLGFFLREYSLARQEFGDRLARGEMSSADLARRVVDSVDNRFGEMNFDNLFWNRTFKTAAQLMFRSVTWKLGNVRAYKDALLGQGRELARPFQGKGAPALDPNMGWLLGMSLWTAALGGAIHSIATGQAPQQMKDFIYPIIDKASGIRVSVPTYWRDMVSAAHSPLGYAKSGMSGEIGRLADIWQNKDFYGNDVYNPDDPLPRQVLDGVEHMVPMPFSAQSKKQAQQQGGSAAAQAAGYAGFTKAPSWLEMTPMQQRMREYQAALRPVGGRTSQQAQSDQLRADILRGLRKGSDMSGVIDTAVQHGMLSQQQVRSLYRSSLEDPDARGFARMDINQAAELFGLANKEERDKLQPLLETKAWRALANPGRWTPKTKQSIHALGLPTPDESQQLQPQ